jgi:hypothetical protein
MSFLWVTSCRRSQRVVPTMADYIYGRSVRQKTKISQKHIFVVIRLKGRNSSAVKL